jgi:hypothetical protein
MVMVVVGVAIVLVQLVVAVVVVAVVIALVVVLVILTAVVIFVVVLFLILTFESLVVALCTNMFHITNSTVCPQIVFKCSVFISQPKTIISLKELADLF